MSLPSGRWALGSAGAALLLWVVVASLDPGESGACVPGLNSLPFGGSVASAADCMRIASGWYIGLDFGLIAALLLTGLAGTRWIQHVVVDGSPDEHNSRVWCRHGVWLGQGLVVLYAIADVVENALLLSGPPESVLVALGIASSVKLASLLLGSLLLTVVLVWGGRRITRRSSQDIPGEIAGLIENLAEPERYRKGFGGEHPAAWVRRTRSERKGDTETLTNFHDRSCDITMRGGTTSGVVYPLAVCALAERYVIRSVGGASAGAIAAAATAAAELGRFAEPVERVGSSSVQPGFAGLAQLVRWLTDPPDEAERRATKKSGEQWRLARLFQPGRALRPLFRIFLASMQNREKTGLGRARAITFAVLGFRWWTFVISMVAVALFLVLPAIVGLVWGPGARPDTDGVRPVVVVALVMFLAFLASRPITHRLRVVIVLLLTPMLSAMLLAWLVGRSSFPQLGLTIAASLVITIVLAVFVVGAFILALYPLIGKKFGDAGYGMVPGVRGPGDPWLVRLFDRQAGLPDRGVLPPLAEWLADRIDDLAGIPDAGDPGRHCLTIRELWIGRLEGKTAFTTEELSHVKEAERSSAKRVINLALMTTDISEGRPFRLPFVSATSTQNVDGRPWLFCEACLDAVVPRRVVEQLVAHSDDLVVPTGADTGSCCPRHPANALHPLPEPGHLPVVLLARMSLSLPGVLAAVPLYRYHCLRPRGCYDGWGRQNDGAPGPPAPRWTLRTHWMSDGGITSNFPIHFFDNMLPLWPTFGLNLQHYPEPDPADIWNCDEDLYFPEQEMQGSAAFVRTLRDATTFIGGIFSTFMGWRDTMQSELPGFQGRIINVRQAAWEGGTNFFMSRLTVLRLATRGYHAGKEIVNRFNPVGPGAENQTDRYRWIRMRIAAREYRQISADVRDRLAVYGPLLNEFVIPGALAGWVTDTSGGPLDPDRANILAALTHISALTREGWALEFPIGRGKPPINPKLHVSPPE